MQAAVAAANSQPGVMYLPAGSYLLSKPLAVLSSGVVIRGAGVSRETKAGEFELNAEEACCIASAASAHGAQTSRPCPAGLQENATRIVISQPLSAVYPNTRFESDQGGLICFQLQTAPVRHHNVLAEPCLQL